METIINKDKTQGHIISPYNFKVIKSFENEQSKEQSVPITPSSPSPSEEKVDFQALQPEMVEAPVAVSTPVIDEGLLKKLDAMSDNMVKLQMQLEQQEARFQEELISTKQNAYEQGKRDAEGEFDTH